MGLRMDRPMVACTRWAKMMETGRGYRAATPSATSVAGRRSAHLSIARRPSRPDRRILGKANLRLSNRAIACETSDEANYHPAF